MRFSVLLAFLVATLTSPLLAAVEDSHLRDQRQRFRGLYIQAQSGSWSSVKKAATNVEGYPLFPYLEAADLEYQLRRGNAQDTRLSALFTRHPDLGAAQTLRSRWLKDLARRGEWKRVAEFYQASDDDELRCLHAKAQIRLGQGEALLNEIKQLWLTPKSLPDSCDAVFDWLEQRKQLTPELIQSRARLAMAAGETRLVQWLIKQLSGDARRDAEVWVEIRQDPFRRLNQLIEKPQAGVSAETIAQGLRQAARKDTLKAAKLYEPLARLYLKTPESRDNALGLLGLEMALDRDVEALEWYSKLSQHPADARAREWRIRTAIYHGDWGKARDWIKQLPEAERNDQRWRYWLARSYEGLPGVANQQVAQAQYALLARERGYYPYLAADRLKQNYVLNHQRVPADPALRSRLETKPAALRTREFLALGYEPQARKEWRGLTREQSALELRQSAVLAESWNWHTQAIMTLAKSEYWDDLHLRYPLLYKTDALAAARHSSVDSGWVYGIMRAESLFIPDARSHAKAVGLMQLLPSTAQRVARSLGIRYHGESTLLDPASNLRLGAEYLRQMRSNFEGNLAMATAAYNAGPTRVKHWLPRASMPADVWVENIPFDETRTYVQRVMEHAVAFDWRLGGQITPLSKRMPAVPAR